MLEKATLSDLEFLLPLVREFHVIEKIDLSDSRRRDAIVPLLENAALGGVWLIWYRNELVGYIAICFGYSIEMGGKDAFVDELFLLEHYRGKGLGGAVLKNITNELTEYGLKALHLEVAHDNLRARGLYESVGFKSRDKFQLMTLSM